MRLVGLWAIGLALAGCALPQQPVQMHRDFVVSQETPIGYLVGSIGRMPVGSYPAYEFTVCDQNRRPVVTLRYKTGLGGLDDKQIDESDYFGQSFAVPLPAGDYIICDSFTQNWQMPAQYYKNGIYIPPMGGGGWSPARGLAIPLKVESGKVNYIGRYKAVLIKGYNALGLPGADGSFWVVTDHQAADLPYAQQRESKLAGLPVVSAVPPKDQLPAPLFFPALPADYKGW
jgi:hypothetical protein